MKSKTIVAIVTIGALLGIALFKDIDGVLLSSGIAVIAGLAGYAAHAAKTKNR